MLKGLTLGLCLFITGLLCLNPPLRAQLTMTGVGGGFGGAPAGFTLISNSVSSGDAVPGPNSTGSINTTGANLLVVFVTQYDGYTIGSVTDSKGNTWTGLTAKSSLVGTYARIYYVASPAVGSGHTFTFGNGGVFNGWIAVQAWSGAHASPFDQESGAIAANVSSIKPGSVTPAQNNSLVVTGLSMNSGNTYVIDSGYTITANSDAASGPNNQGSAMAYLVQGTAALTDPTWSFSGGLAVPAAVLAVFKPQ